MPHKKIEGVGDGHTIMRFYIKGSTFDCYLLTARVKHRLDPSIPSIDNPSIKRVKPKLG